MFKFPEKPRQFIAENGSEFCRELKSVHHVPCEKCVECAARLFEESRG
ncbi:MAG: hypothetical protein IJH79_10815 [Lentisphaeria bacterium]|nr:hypothetical protein [Lentisphaeria bacterium]